ncbi:hypothetical protein OAG53_01065 [Akkermansiaceae bacterium]|nr:hypothetical protein [Akkermansiaceae bacterium]
MKHFITGLGTALGFCIIILPLFYLMRPWLTDYALSAAEDRAIVDQDKFEIDDVSFVSRNEKNYLTATITNLTEGPLWNVVVEADVTEEDDYPVDSGRVLLRHMKPGESKKFFISIGYEYTAYTDHWKYDVYVSRIMTKLE